ncbi:MAG: hypothetical protein OXG24_02075, partial [Gammaproteobacteria bacterium]|nr:hypothetical protein [Gammaproteobacteria bacterium]
FVFLLGGRLLAAGIPITQVDGIYRHQHSVGPSVDLSFSWDRSPTTVECKRARSKKNLIELAVKGCKQVEKSGRFGVLALDCSLLVRPEHTVLEIFSRQLKSKHILDWLETEIWAKRMRDLIQKYSSVLGMILYCRVPAMTRILEGSPTIKFRRDCVTTIACCSPGTRSLGNPMMQEINDRLHATASGKAIPRRIF